MLFRTITGEVIEINRYDFINDKLYYAKIIEIKTPFIQLLASAKLKKTFNNKNNQYTNKHRKYITTNNIHI